MKAGEKVGLIQRMRLQKELIENMIVETKIS